MTYETYAKLSRAIVYALATCPDERYHEFKQAWSELRRMKPVAEMVPDWDAEEAKLFLAAQRM